MNLRPKPTTLLLAALFSGVLAAHAQLSIPSDGSDGAFNPTTNIEINLGLATTALWNSPGSGNGVYDPDKWAVVFKYSSVNIPAGVTVTFKNHPTYAPVVWLVQGDVTIAGTLNLKGADGTSDSVRALIPTEPGPGGFRGGARGPGGVSWGYGPGGGGRGLYYGSYGNPQVIPLIAGSGGSSGSMSGGAGGGGILIATQNIISVGGTIDARGGTDFGGSSAAGSGGAVKLIANSVGGSGTITTQTTGGNPGRIRIESFSLATTLNVFPETIAVPPAATPILWPAANAPTARVVSVDNVNAPLDPSAPVIAAADVPIQNSGQVNILIETKNFPIEGVVQLFVIPKFAARSTLTATRLSGDITSAIWRVQTTLPQGFVTLQARATQP